MKNYTQFKKRVLKNPQIKRAYQELEPEFKLAALLMERRLQQQLTQKELAERVGTKQSAISRLESGAYNPSWSFLHKVADALDARLKISIDAK